jgi:hypothetical protein
MEMRIISFIPPIIGTEGEFNTFRLGSFYFKNLKIGEEVFLLNEKEKLVIGRARVMAIEQGTLDDMCQIHGHKNHTELKNEREGAGDRLLVTMKKIYGPHIAVPTKKVTVLYLQRLE